MSLIVHAANRARSLLVVLEKAVAAGSLLLLLLIMLVQLVARSFFEAGFSDLDVLARNLVLFITLMGAALVTESGRHIKIDILSNLMKERHKRLLVQPLLLISTAVCASFAWYAARFWIDEWTYAPDNEHLSLYLALILPVGFTVLFLHFLFKFIAGFEYVSPASRS
jgi:TRAP-type C4-dicarboxylate transport system permease small subunit